MYEWEVRYSETKREGSRISCESWKATVYAVNRQAILDGSPGRHGMTFPRRSSRNTFSSTT